MSSGHVGRVAQAVWPPGAWGAGPRTAPGFAPNTLFLSQALQKQQLFCSWCCFLYIFSPECAPTAYTGSYFQSHRVSLSFAAEGDVCPDLSIAAKGPDSSLYLDRQCSPWYKERMEGIKVKTSLQSISLTSGSVFSSDYWYFGVHAVPEHFPSLLGLSWAWGCVGVEVEVGTALVARV